MTDAAVRKLKWHEGCTKTPMGEYAVSHLIRHEFIGVLEGRGMVGVFDSEQEAMDGCQMDFEKRVKECFE